MTHQAILEKAMRKAIDNGWQPSFNIKKYRLTIGFKIEKPFEASGADWSANDIIFRHDFAQALWGEEEREPEFNFITKQGWKGYLQQMVIADDPLDFLGAHI